VTPLRQIDAAAAAADAVLFRPQLATRVRFNMNTDTPLPPEEPGGENPPDGAVIDYALKADAAGPVTLEIVDGTGRTIRRYSSEDKAEIPTPETAPVPLYWYRRPLVLQAAAGMHRFLWDMRYQPLEASAGGRGRGGLPISATPFNTVPVPNSIWAPPGLYTVKLTVAGKTTKQPLLLRMDPRVRTSPPALARLHEMSLSLYDGILGSQQALRELRVLRAELKKRLAEAAEAGRPAEAGEAIALFDKKAADLEGGAAGPGGGPGGPMGFRGGGAAASPDSLAMIGFSLNSLMSTLQASDTEPTTQLAAAVAERLKALDTLLEKLKSLKTRELDSLNQLLKAAHLAEILL
jgi:hypothetical protein